MPGRLPAVRVLAEEVGLMTHVFKADTDDSNPPSYALAPSGVAANKVLLAGVVSDVTEVENDIGTVLATLNDHSGDITISASKEYSPQAADFLLGLEPPQEVMVVVKVGNYENSDGELQQTVNVKEGEHGIIPTQEYDQWAHETIEQTIDRLTELEEGSNSDLGPNYDPFLQYDEDTVAEVREIVSTAIENFESSRQ
jgi:RPA family protein